jgi:hypothetical protein
MEMRSVKVLGGPGKVFFLPKMRREPQTHPKTPKTGGQV